MLHSRRVPILARSSREKWGFIGLWVAQRFNVAIKIPKPQPVILSEAETFASRKFPRSRRIATLVSFV
jgi:hypothetical protein